MDTTPPGEPSLRAKYFRVFFSQKKALNEIESIYIAKATLGLGKISMVEQWIKENLLTISEQLGDLLVPHNKILALGIYLKAGIHSKVTTI